MACPCVKKFCVQYRLFYSTPKFPPGVENASQAYFGKSAVYMGEGGSIPFMATLGERFPQAQFLITGVLGPHSNAHGPNEFLHIPTGKRLTCSVAQVIEDHYNAALSPRSPDLSPSYFYHRSLSQRWGCAQCFELSQSGVFL